MRIPLVAALLAVACGPAFAATATNDTATVINGASSPIPVIANDIGTNIAITKVTQPANGTVSVVAGRLYYKPNAGYTGTDTFTYTIADGLRQGRVERGANLLVRTNSGGTVTAFSSGQGSALVPVGAATDEFWMLTDRGPNADGAGDDKIFPVPGFQPKIVRVKRQANGTFAIQATVNLFAANGTTPISGLPGSATAGQPGFNGDIPVAIGLPRTVLAYDANGLDPEGLAVDAGGNFWVADEYGPYLVKFNATGIEQERLAPNAANTLGRKLPQVLLKRFKNRGLEGLTLTPSGKLVGIVQNALRTVGTTSTVAVARDTNILSRIVVIDPTVADDLATPANEAVAATKQYAYLMDVPGLRISEITALSETKFLIIERDDAFLGGPGVVKKIWQIDITGATDLNDAADGAHGASFGGATPEQIVQGMTNAQAITALAAATITPATRTGMVLDLAASLGNGYPHDKIEGLAVLAKDASNNPTSIALVNDDDFGLTNFDPVAANEIKQKANAANGGWADYTEILVADLAAIGGTATGTVTVTVTGAGAGTAIATNAASHLLPVASGVIVKPILSAGQSVGGLRHDGLPYVFVGIPDGLGAFDNGDGTFTLLMNHELGGTAGVARAHGNIGAFVSRWVINKTSLAVTSMQDHNQSNASIHLWNTATSAYLAPGTTTYLRFCSADLAPVTSLKNGTKGTAAKIFMNGEETGAEGRVFAHVVSGASSGQSWQLPRLGRGSWETYALCPQVQDATVGIGTDDASPGQVYLYVGTKQVPTPTSTVVDDAGLTNGNLFAIQVGANALEDRLAPFGGIVKGGSTAFTCTTLNNVANLTGAAIDALGGTKFLRPEDGAWDPSAPSDFYFVTTDRQDDFKNGGNSVAVNQGRSRLWRLRFANIATPQTGGTLTLLIDGSENPGPQMMDNLCLDTNSRILIQEDPGTFDFAANIWSYDISGGALAKVAKYDPALFGDRAAGVDVPPSASRPTAFTRDEEASGVIDAKAILGNGWYLLDSQAHTAYGDTEVVEHGQMLAMYVPPAPVVGPGVTPGPVAGNNDDDDNGCGSGSGIGLLIGFALLALGLTRQRLK